MFKKVLFILIILIFTIGVVSADDFKAPENFEKYDDTHFGNGTYYISIVNFTDDQHDFWFKSDSSIGHNVFTFKNDTYQSITSGQIGIFELVEIDGEKYIIQSWSFFNPNKCYDFLIEFNQLNNLTPIKVL